MRIALAESELAERGLTPAQFRRLRIPERRRIASNILRNRPDAESHAAADMIERGNPNASDFDIYSGI
jgi:hypothetical protein